MCVCVCVLISEQPLKAEAHLILTAHALETEALAPSVRLSSAPEAAHLLQCKINLTNEQQDCQEIAKLYFISIHLFV